MSDWGPLEYQARMHFVRGDISLDKLIDACVESRRHEREVREAVEEARHAPPRPRLFSSSFEETEGLLPQATVAFDDETGTWVSI